MDIVSLLILAFVFFFSLLAVIRTYPRRRWVTILVLLLPVIYFSLRWARYRSSWGEFLIGTTAALLSLLIWWMLKGRKLAPAKEGSIRVWSEDDPF